MYLLPLILSNTFWCLFVFSVSFLGRQPIRGLCLPPFRANYSAGSPSSVRETAGETAAALFGSYLPSSSSLPPLSSSAWVAMAWRAPGPAIISAAFASDFLFWRCSSFQPSFLLLFPFVAAQCVHQEPPVNVSCRLDDRPEDRQGTDGRQAEGTGLRRKAASQVAAPINSIAHLHIWGSGRHRLSLSPTLALSLSPPHPLSLSLPLFLWVTALWQHFSCVCFGWQTQSSHPSADGSIHIALLFPNSIIPAENQEPLSRFPPRRSGVRGHSIELSCPDTRAKSHADQIHFSRLRRDSKGCLTQFCVAVCLRFIFISSRLQISFLLPLTLLLLTYFIHPPSRPPPWKWSRICLCDLLSIRGLKINYAGSHA